MEAKVVAPFSSYRLPPMAKEHGRRQFCTASAASLMGRTRKEELFSTLSETCTVQLTRAESRATLLAPKTDAVRYLSCSRPTPDGLKQSCTPLAETIFRMQEHRGVD